MLSEECARLAHCETGDHICAVILRVVDSAIEMIACAKFVLLLWWMKLQRYHAPFWGNSSKQFWHAHIVLGPFRHCLSSGADQQA